jgi:phosphoribosyl 1,2-cyclic phosphate phosphodiesterase
MSSGTCITVLGSGTSTGVPVVGCGCAVCRSGHPRNQRTRASLLVEREGRAVLVDTSADLRGQCLREEVQRIDAVVYTHAHADHIYGLDDVRPYNFKQQASIPCYGSAHTLEGVRSAFAYIFDQKPAEGGGKPLLTLHAIAPGPFEVAGMRWTAIPVRHGSLEVLAFRIGDFAYVTDCHLIPPASLEQLRGLEVLILGALRHRPHPTHFSLAQAIAVARELAPGRTYFTHTNHELDYDAVAAELPPGMELAYDGLRCEFS